MRTNTDLTLYNKAIEDKVEVYYRTQVKLVSWENSKQRNRLATGGSIQADQATIYIPFTSGGVMYMPPKTWLALEDKSTNWTLQADDYVVKGLVDDEIHALIPAVIDPPAAAIPAFLIKDLIAKYDDVLKVMTVDTMDLGSDHMRHWKISAK